ncbi:ATP-binding cassette domain-containing protein [Acidaminobacter sp. JC074]|uniref:ABC transporter ATP-binding protein n=1 Tax=Acidaminobacter sp. JC074 TaxID=2530199 RepID=UPI001F1025F0|nr:oligopeptide/dipeptide ABC transporter ATP-binding protein [Acidaminobacter sp. JC074]MCH4887057.1 ATP-binding cassette domain-containing protein [Acidaminobacter sp. JC074]
MSKFVEVKNLKKYFPTPMGMLHAVDNLDFSIEKGKTLGIVGESGCGKSTTGRLLTRLHEATDGEIYFDGREISTLKGKELKNMRERVQIIFQDPFASLNPRRTVSDTIEEPLIIHKVIKNKAKRREKVLELMNMVGLSERLINAYPHELDGGRRQRIGIARALALNPDFIVCDEPVSALDVSIQAQILNLLNDLKERLGLTYVFITHDLSVVKHFSDEIMVMYLGEMVEKASVKQLFLNPKHPYTKALLSAIPVPSIRNKRERVVLKGEITSPINPPQACRFAPRCIYATDKCFNELPEITKIDDGHTVRCLRIGEI